MLKKSIIITTFSSVVIIVLVTLIAIIGSTEIDQAEEFIEYTYEHVEINDDGILIKANEFIDTESASIDFIESFEGRKDVIKWSGGGSLEWDFEVPEDGIYEVVLGYYPIEDNGRDIEFNLYVNDENPLVDVAPIKLTRIWKDDSVIKQNAVGNDLRPKQVEQPLWSEEVIKLPTSLKNDSLGVSLKKGRNQLRLESIRENIVLDYFKLVKKDDLEDYKSYISNFTNIEEVSGILQKVQAENAYLKSTSGLYPTNDRTSPITEPYHPTKIRMNTIGADNWDQLGEWISWKVDIPKDGFYKIGMRYRQNSMKGLFVSRKVYIDGKIPFQEMEENKFPYDLGWKVQVLGDDDPYLFYLTEGTHEIKMETTLGELANSLEDVQETILELNQIYREIIMITGTTPDMYRDYDLGKSIPSLVSSFEELSKQMHDQAKELEKISGYDNGGSRLLQLLERQINLFVKDPGIIPKSLNNYKSNITGLADWMVNAMSQPLELDYIFIASPDADVPVAETNIVQNIVHETKAFMGSFFEDFDNIGGSAESEDNLDVWVGLGRDQAYVLNRLITESFTPETNININLNLVQDSLVVAVMAGEGPDVNLFTGRGDAMNLAMRGALTPLQSLSDFQSIKKDYMETAFVPYEYQDQVFAIPEEQEFFMMYYREDVFADLGISPPDTWEDLMEIAPILQYNNMQIGLPYEDIDGFQLMNSGIGTLNLFPTLLKQHNTDIYEESHEMTRFDEPNAYIAFNKWTDFYNLYGYPLYKDDFNRFRTGEMPLVITTYKLYNRLTAAAPEINGTWKMTSIPGVRGEDGEVNRVTAATGTSSVILEDSDNKEIAWEFLKWWNSSEIQSEFTRQLESEIGVLGRRTPANLVAFEQTNWSHQEQNTLLEQWNFVDEIPEVPGGYYTSRNIDNAFRSVVFQWENPRESLFYWNREINDEIDRKRYEFGLKTE